MIISDHFKDQWIDRVGFNVPSEADLDRFVETKIRLQRHCDVKTPDGRKIYKVLGMYWDPVTNVVIKVDHKRNRAVTVISPKLLGERDAGVS